MKVVCSQGVVAAYLLYVPEHIVDRGEFVTGSYAYMCSLSKRYCLNDMKAALLASAEGCLEDRVNRAMAVGAQGLD